MKSHKSYNFKTVAIAGTFDRLHKGHRFFISEAFKLGERVIIGVTSDEFVKRKLETRNLKLEQIKKCIERKKELEGYLKAEGLLGRAEIIEIEDVYGPAVEDNKLEALVVTVETLEGGEQVNRKRKELGLPPLKLLTVPMILAEDKKRIASTRIRLGEIDRLGNLFVSRINENLRQELKKPMGILIKGNPENLNFAAEKLKKAVGKTNSSMIITVGDEVTRVCNEVGIAINLAIVDFRVHREEKYHSLGELGIRNKELGVKVVNPAGHITKELVDAVKNAYLGIIKDGRQRIIKVEGEEDLAGVPALLLAPLGGLMIYGQPDKGVVVVDVTESIKEKLLDLIAKY